MTSNILDNNYFDLLIAGAGIVGLSAALAMAQRGHSVAIISKQKPGLPNHIKLFEDTEAQNTKPKPARVYAINRASSGLFQELGVWENILKPRSIELKKPQAYTAMHVWEAKKGGALDFNAPMILAHELGWMIEENTLHTALVLAIKKHPAITWFDDCNIDGINEKQQLSDTTKHGISLQSGEQAFNAQLLIIADGANSICREHLKIPITTWPYQQEALIATVRHSKPHQKTARQIFNQSDILAFLPLENAHESSIVWSTTPEKSKTLRTLSEEDFNRALSACFEEQLGTSERISALSHFPLTMRHTQQYVGSRWLLLGDAAHSIHPLAGLGLNLGLADLKAWLNCLDNNNLASSKALMTYQRNRKAKVWPIILAMESIKQCMGSQSGLFKSLRSLGLKLINHSHWIKRFFIEQASGISD